MGGPETCQLHQQLYHDVLVIIIITIEILLYVVHLVGMTTLLGHREFCTLHVRGVFPIHIIGNLIWDLGKRPL